MLTMLLSMLSNEEDRRALFELYEQYQGVLQRIARSIFPDDPHTVDDVVQTVWLHVIESFSKIYDIPCEKRGGYLVIIAKNESLSLLRSRRRELLANEAQSDEAADELSDAAPIIDLIRSMPEVYRAVLELRFVEERSTKEIAALLELSEGAVDMRIHRGRKLLLKKLQEEGYTV
ncbi:MAG: sigma-70 family RNA polymerase sigma factor [Oscillospiraceae bacterium]|nr:sigma-70 family RNA polymerase sigma factor [Oscillospiraceae bacterium]